MLRTSNGTLVGAWHIQARRFASRSSTRQTTHLNSDKKVNSKPSETGRSPLNRLANRPVILRSSAHFEFLRLFFLPSVFGCVLFWAAFFLRRPILLPQKPFFSPFRVWLYSLKTSKIHAKPISTHSRFFIGVWYNRRCYNDITFWYISVTSMSLYLPISRGIVVTQSNSQRRIARIASRVFLSQERTNYQTA